MNVRAWVRRLRDKLLSAFYEGPQAPERLGHIVDDFAVLNPHATRGDWVEFAKNHGDECYRSGYMRGLEALHRDLEGGLILLEHGDEVHDWRWNEGMATIAEQELEDPVVDGPTTLHGHHQQIEWSEHDERDRVGKRRRRV